jgi:hypothetical protein
MKRSMVTVTLGVVAVLLSSAALARQDEVVRSCSPHTAKGSQSAKTSHDNPYTYRTPVRTGK